MTHVNLDQLNNYPLVPLSKVQEREKIEKSKRNIKHMDETSETKETETEQAGQTIPKSAPKIATAADKQYQKHRKSPKFVAISYILLNIGVTIFYISQIGLGMIGLYCRALIFIFLSPLLQALTIVISLLVFDVYSEIQSWHIAYLTWAMVFAGIGFYQYKIHGFNEFAVVYQFTRFFDIKAEDFDIKPKDFDIKPKDFDINKKKERAGGVEYCLWSIVPLYPGLIAGLIANWILADRYELDCDTSYDINSSKCVVIDGICCKLQDLTVDIGSMFGILGANILLGYRITGYIIRYVLFCHSHGEYPEIKGCWF